MNKKNYWASLGLLYASAIWGSTFVVTKNSLTDVAPTTLAALRFTLAALCLIPILWWRRLRVRFDLGSVCVGLALAGVYLPQTIGLGFTNVSNSAFITGLFVAFLPILELVILKKRPSRIDVVTVVLCVLGIWALTGGLHQLNIGDMLTLVTAFCYALHIVLMEGQLKRGRDALTLTFEQFVVVAVLAYLASLLGNAALLPSSTMVWGAILYLGILATVLAFLAQGYAQQYASPMRVGVIFALEPFFGAVFGWTLGGEPFATNKLFGGLLILCALIVREVWQAVASGSRTSRASTP